MQKFALSVIVLTYNRRKLLEYTLNSLLLQDISKDTFEVIIVDDGSIDDTREAIDKYTGSLTLKYYFQEDRGYRPGTARNIGILHAEGAICLFVDSGVILNISCVREHISMHSNTNRRAAILGYVYGFDQDGSSESELKQLITPIDPAGSITRLISAGIGFDIREKYYKKYNDKIEDLPAPWIYFWTCNVSVQKKDLIEVGNFDSNYDGKWGCEDNDLGFRLCKNGVKILLCRRADSIHYPHVKDLDSKVNQGFANCKYLHNKFRTQATSYFFRYYKQFVMNESIDVNELLSQIKDIN
jgi:glycosyltransferase involved in cell wall biosynthesis